ncbi:MAG: flavodoxin family protein [Cellulosilyticum sp.]|nr:flavodoxin family protein [Cellulosilyticum sp.]
MNATILYETINDVPLSSSINSALTHTFGNVSNVSLIEIIKENIKPCIGCFGCWIKNPGQCMIKNDLTTMTTPAFVQSDVMVIVSSIHYGSYSATMKRVIDRSIPNILPFFRQYKNEVHHQMRYKKLARQIILAYGDNLTTAEKETFIKLTKANATNFGINDPTVYFCNTTEDIHPILSQIQTQLQINQ